MIAEALRRPRPRGRALRVRHRDVAPVVTTASASPETRRASTCLIGVVVVTHGQLATELVNAAETIVGDLPQFAAVSIGWHDDVDDAREDDRGRRSRACAAPRACCC